MKRTILLTSIMMYALSFVSCQKDDEFAPMKFPDPPTSGNITYKVCKSTAVHPEHSLLDAAPDSSFIRKITFLYDWKDSAGIIVPLCRDTVVAGDFIFTVAVRVIRELSPQATPDTPGKYCYKVPVALGWEAVNNQLSITTIEADADDNLVIASSGTCPSLGRPLPSPRYYYFPGLDRAGLYDR